MGQAAGDTEMTNLALAWLGSSSRIANIEQAGAVAEAARNSLSIQVPAIQERHPWNCCVTRGAIPSTSNVAAENDEYAWRYELANDCLRWLPWRPGDFHYFDAVQEGQFLLSNCEGPVTARWIRLEPDRTKWTPLLATAVTAQLAVDLAEAVSADQSVRDRMMALFDKTMADAQRSDALATGDTSRPAPAQLSRAVAAMRRGGRGDPARFHR